MSEFKFVPRYYEWHLYKGNEIIYTFDDFLDELPEYIDEEAACDMADTLMFGMMHDEEHPVELTDREFVEATEVMVNTIWRL